MKKFLPIILIFSCISCVSLKKYNNDIELCNEEQKGLKAEIMYLNVDLFMYEKQIERLKQQLEEKNACKK
jgi:peptidoglycan hydrolase CwlO-like protein